MCIFCKIVAGEIPNKTVLENDDFLTQKSEYTTTFQAKTNEK